MLLSVTSAIGKILSETSQSGKQGFKYYQQESPLYLKEQELRQKNNEELATKTEQLLEELKLEINSNFSNFTNEQLAADKIVDIIKHFGQIRGNVTTKFADNMVSLGNEMSTMTLTHKNIIYGNMLSKTTDALKTALLEIFSILNEKFSVAYAEIRHLEKEHNIKSIFDAVWLSFRTFLIKRDKSSKQILLDDCKNGGTDRVIMGVHSYLFDKKQGFQYSLQQRHHAVETLSHLQEFFEKIIIQMIGMRAFCYGLESRFNYTGILQAFVEQNNIAVDVLNSEASALKTRYWNHPDGIDKLVCASLKRLDSQNVSMRATTLLNDLDKAYNLHGDKFGVVVGHSAMGVLNQVGIIEENDDKSRPINLGARKTNSILYLNSLECPKVTQAVEVLIVRDNNGLSSNGINAAEYFKELIPDIESNFFPTSISWSVANAVDRYRYRQTDRRTRCLFHLVTRHNQSDVIGIKTDGFAMNVETNQFHTNSRAGKATFQIVSIC